MISFIAHKRKLNGKNLPSCPGLSNLGVVKGKKSEEAIELVVAKVAGGIVLGLKAIKAVNAVIAINARIAVYSIITINSRVSVYSISTIYSIRPITSITALKGCEKGQKLGELVWRQATT